MAEARFIQTAKIWVIKLMFKDIHLIFIPRQVPHWNERYFPIHIPKFGSRLFIASP